MKTIYVSVVAIGMLAISSAAHAVPCGTGLDTTNVTFRGSDADACAGPIIDNDNGSNLGLGGDSFSLLAKYDIPDGEDDGSDVSNTFFGVKWTLTADAGKSGSWTLGWSTVSTPGLPLQMDLAVVVKGSNRFGSWLFTAEEFYANPSSGSGTFQITYLNNGNQIPDLSHLSVYGRNPTSDCCENEELPEPGSLALLGLGLLGLGIGRRRKV